jgi:hypothetical protein
MTTIQEGASPEAFRRACEARTESLRFVDTAVSSLCEAIRDGAPTLLDGPLLGRTLSDLTDSVPESDDHRAETPRRTARPYPEEPSPTGRAGRQVPTATDQRAEPRPVPRPRRAKALPDDGPGRVRHAGSTPFDLPIGASRLDSGVLRRLAGELPVGWHSARRTAAPRRRPRAGAVPNGAVPNGAAPNGTVDRHAAATAAVEAVIQRLGLSTESTALFRTTVPRPGPAAPRTLLRPTLPGQLPGSAAAGVPSAGPSAPGEQPAETSAHTVERRFPGTMAAPAANQEPGTTPRPAVDAQTETVTGSVEVQDDRREVRSVQRFAELPDLRPAERVSVDAPVHPGHGEATEPRATAYRLPVTDLEDLMTRVLDDAARRHGIEV